MEGGWEEDLDKNTWMDWWEWLEEECLQLSCCREPEIERSGEPWLPTSMGIWYLDDDDDEQMLRGWETEGELHSTWSKVLSKRWAFCIVQRKKGLKSRKAYKIKINRMALLEGWIRVHFSGLAIWREWSAIGWWKVWFILKLYEKGGEGDRGIVGSLGCERQWNRWAS